MSDEYGVYKIKSLKPLGDNVIVDGMQFDERITSGGIILRNDDMRSVGIRPRWCRVYAVGPDQKMISVGQWILVDHGRWTRGLTIEDSDGRRTIRRVDVKDILLVSDDPVYDETLSTKEI